MKQKLNLGERFSLLGILPSEGNFASLKVVRKLREDLSLTEEEIKYFDVKQIPSSGGQSQLTWSPEKAMETKEFVFGEFAEDMIKAKLKKFEEEKKLEDKHFSLYEKFIENVKSKEDG